MERPPSPDPQWVLHHHVSIVAPSSTEAELIAAVTAAKIARFLRSVLRELGFPQDGPTPIYEDNKSAIDIVNSNKPILSGHGIY